MADTEETGQKNIPPSGIPVLIKTGMFLSLAISIVITFIYLTGEDFSDEILLFLLRVLRVSSFFVFVFSMYLFIISIRNFIIHPVISKTPSIFLYFLSALSGAGLIVFNSFIVAISGGNM